MKRSHFDTSSFIGLRRESFNQIEELGGDAGAGCEDADAVVVAVAFDGGSGLLGDEFAGACFSSSGYKGSTKF